MRPMLLIAGLFVSLLIAVVLVIYLVRVPQMIAVKGSADIEVTPDVAVIEVGVGKTNGNSHQAAIEVAQVMTDILAAMKAAGIKDEDITSQDLTSSPAISAADNGEKKMVGYYARQAVLVRVRDYSKIGPLLIDLSKAGSNYWHISYEIEDKKTRMTEVQRVALEDAIRKADLYAKNGGFDRGKILKLQEDDTRFPQVDYHDRDYEVEGTGFGSRGTIETVIVTAERNQGPPPTSFSIPKPEKQKISADVSVLFELD